MKKTLQSDSGVIYSFAIAPDGKTVVSGSGDRAQGSHLGSESIIPIVFAFKVILELGLLMIILLIIQIINNAMQRKTPQINRANR